MGVYIHINVCIDICVKELIIALISRMWNTTLLVLAGASLPLWGCILFTMGQAYLIEARYKPQATNIPLLLARRLDRDANKNSDGSPRVVQVLTPRWQYNAVYGVDSLDNIGGGINDSGNAHTDRQNIHAYIRTYIHHTNESL
jgi:hypothetical protein